MQSRDLAHQHRSSFAGRVVRYLAHPSERDLILLVGVTLLLASGALLGLIHVLAWIHLVAVLLGG